MSIRQSCGGYGYSEPALAGYAGITQQEGKAYETLYGACGTESTKVMLYIAEREALGCTLPIEQVVVNTLKGRHREPEHLARNPFGTLPVLELDDGQFLLESLSIIRFLETVQADSALVQGDAAQQALAFDLERTVELRFANHVGRYVATNSPWLAGGPAARYGAWWHDPSPDYL